MQSIKCFAERLISRFDTAFCFCYNLAIRLMRKGSQEGEPFIIKNYELRILYKYTNVRIGIFVCLYLISN